MLDLEKYKFKKYVFIVFLSVIVVVIFWLKTVDNISLFAPVEVRINAGMGINEIAEILSDAKIISSKFIFKAIAFVTFSADKLRPGKYLFEGQLSIRNIINFLIIGGDEEVTVQIVEGATIYDIDALLSKNNIIKAGELISFNEKQEKSLEGYLFPDTYRFFENSGAEIVVKKMTGVFDEKVSKMLIGSSTNQYETLILASLLEKEVPEFEDRRIVAGILQKRIANKWFLQADATICYSKEPTPCYPLLALDFKVDSKYNSYMYKGLPPTPIGNPGHQAIQAALTPKKSNYWYYISDPKSKKTIFARTLEEHVANKLRYLQ
mgnify:FL=1